jgi:hypothetical protein
VTVGFEVIALEEAARRWDEALAQLPPRLRDVYFTSPYLLLSQRLGEGRAMGGLFRHGETVVLYPFLLRELIALPHLGEEYAGYYDVTTPFGYGGPLIHKRGGDEHAMETFRNAFDRWCAKNRVVSEFVRFHPLLDTELAMQHHVACSPVGTTVWCRLDCSQEERFKTLSPPTRRNVRRALGSDLTFQQESSDEAYESFAELFRQTRERRRSEGVHPFSDRYFRDVRELLGPMQSLLSVRRGEKMIAAGLFLRSQEFVHYHLGGSDPEYLELRPTNLLFFEAMKWGCSLGCTALHLGGGHEANDDLFRFKAGFSPLRARFCIGKRVHDEEAYARATAAREARGPVARAGFFPAYRAPLPAAVA